MYTFIKIKNDAICKYNFSYYNFSARDFFFSVDSNRKKNHDDHVPIESLVCTTCELILR